MASRRKAVHPAALVRLAGRPGILSIVAPCLIVPIFAPVVMGVIGLIEGIIYLIRPDQYIAFRSPTMDQDELTAYLDRLLVRNPEN